ncbi:substrate-binding domain-containing protein [Yinghuangia seranimata]|uniref:substrate-binding domain-containing protein n=1 Tax=Yinghuangia seranimata TaxID=408067 RepID=UPI00248C5EB2|nr:substrate-binding domain-containing protein [Yinghuangia seranimata]MDI2132871.1 substrate-binding domain-containing protein [Yinghuangia seranimata]
MLRKLATAVAATATAMLLAVSAGAAHADNYAGVGSDTTQDVMKALTNQYKLTHPANTWTSINAGATSGSIPASGTCPGVSFSMSSPAPNGSSAGIAALIADTNNCIDYARSSRALKPTETGLTAIRLGGDAVSWSAEAAANGGKAPSNISRSQLQDIYRCVATDWSQVGGSAGSIVRYVPQAGSGTRDFFFNTVLGFDPTVLGGSNLCATQPNVVQENKGNQVTAADKNTAILPYSKAAWTAQSNSGVTGVADARNGFVLGNIDGIAPGTTSPTAFIGNRSVYNVYKNTNAPQDLLDFLNWAAAQNSIKATYGFTA